ncbi:MAG: hypothetical protein KME07_24785 [Pegethrix bostrychoides GSE-TBD4-15B]|jgi:hypothetical protein|uniref:DUF1574 domain-containing protein n=1 Tax=Pegethrix bostrychoides GSE-TBD4-15B TaxID=2839662 RepID=A0A951PHG9_9CYAN|nr:hypothetical protein [Pegethrix bostrychoides GSE-TBD4-15B]
MISKKLLMFGVLLLSASGLGGVAWAEISRDRSQTSNHQPDYQPDPASRLSSLILPLPPLVVPDLLLPPYDFPSFSSERLDQELQLYLKYLRTQGKPDILVMGSSRSLQGIDPAALEEALAAQGHPGLRVYNFGINGATAQVMNLLVQHILTPEQLPKLIIWGDGSRAFNNGRPDRTYDQILSSPGYHRVAAGEQPIPARTFAWEIPTFVSTSNKALSSAARSTQAAHPVNSDLTVQGFEKITEEYDPNRYYQRFPYVPGQFDADYRAFNLRGEQAEATTELARFARAEGITLVVVNLPLSRDYLDAVRRDYERQFQQHMWQLARQEQFMFRNLSQQPELMNNSYFADPSHINYKGARAIAFQLAADSTIPWRVARPVSNSTAGAVD